MRDRHRLDEVLLEARLDRGLDLLDAAHHVLDLAPGGAGQQRDQRAGPGGVARGPDTVDVAVRDQAEDHRVERVDLAAERPGEPHAVHRLDAEAIHSGRACELGDAPAVVAAIADLQVAQGVEVRTDLLGSGDLLCDPVDAVRAQATAVLVMGDGAEVPIARRQVGELRRRLAV